MKKKQQQIEEDLRQHQNDATVWSDEPDQVVVVPTQTSTVTVRMPKGEFFALVKAAKIAGESVAEYISAAIKLRQEHDAEMRTRTHP